MEIIILALKEDVCVVEPCLVLLSAVAIGECFSARLSSLLV